MTSDTILTTPAPHWRKHIAVSRGKFARATNTRDRNVRLEIWFAGWRIEIYVS